MNVTATIGELPKVWYRYTDALGSVRAITDAAGQVVERYDYLPFGEPWPASPPAVQDRSGSPGRIVIRRPGWT